MATNSTSEKRAQVTGPARLFPEEKFWKRYSPHHEMPLSTIGSFALHSLGIGALILIAWMGWFGFGNSGESLPVEPVRFKVPGDGDVKVTRSGKAPESAPGVEPVETADAKNDPTEPAENKPTRTTLDPNAIPKAPTEVQNDDPFKRPLQAGANFSAFKKLEKLALDKLRDGRNPRNVRGGNGSGADKGTETGPDDRDGRSRKGPSASLSQSVKRMLRWSMVFDTRTGMEYLTQLRSLGAVLAIPVGPEGKNYRIVRDLSGKGPPKLLDEDIAQIQCIFWVDDRSESVRSLMTALHYDQTPKHFVAFMPRELGLRIETIFRCAARELEEELFELEKKFRGRSEDQIHETKFRIVPGGKRGYKPVVVEQQGR